MPTHSPMAAVRSRVYSVNGESSSDRAGWCTCDPECECDECRRHGRVLRLLAGASHKIWFREGGTVWACYAWWNPQRHKHVQFTTLPDGSLLPNDRGGRRTAVIDDVSAILRAHGVAVTSRGTPGRRSKLPLSEIVADVGRRRPTDDSFEAVFKAVAAERDCEWDSVRRRYWVDGKDLREHPRNPPRSRSWTAREDLNSPDGSPRGRPTKRSRSKKPHRR